ncbi:MAG: hypothetical protein ACJAW7_003002, partial [Candidatus Azotimanducaceae bacterium]
ALDTRSCWCFLDRGVAFMQDRFLAVVVFFAIKNLPL